MLVAGLELIIANFVEPWLYGASVGISSLALLVMHPQAVMQPRAARQRSSSP